MLIDLECLDNKNCLLYHNEGYLHCSWVVGTHVVTIEHISRNHPPLILCAWESLAEWWKAVSDVAWLEEDLLSVAKDLLEGNDLDQPARELMETWVREQEEQNRDEDNEGDGRPG